MISPFLRSSALNTHEVCQQQFFINYSLGIQQIVNSAAQKGSIFHKVMEIIAKIALLNKTGEPYFIDEDIGKFENRDVFSYDIFDILNKVYNFFVENTDFEGSPSDYLDCQTWIKNILEFNDGDYDPRKRNIVQAEQFFDFELKRDWSKYKFSVGENNLEGHVRLRGTVDLITEVSESPKVWEIVDYKTGLRKNWANDKLKDDSNLKDDIQLRFYHYAISTIFPDVEDIIITLFYLRESAPFPVYFTKSDMLITEEMLKNKYMSIINNQRPKLRNDYKCRFCSFSKGDFQNSGQPACEFFRDKILQIGMPKVIDKYADLKSLKQYQGGGSVRE